MVEEKDNSQLEFEIEIPPSALAKSQDQVRIRTERFSGIYANNLQVGFSMWDMSVTFGEVVGEQEGKPVIEELVQVKMTREIGKALLMLLSSNIAEFEKQSGHKILIPVLTQEKSTQKSPSESEKSSAIEATDQPSPS